ncbi:MAG: DUF1553 domain-containing protein, partial [Planctomycetaceae bacterium]|nr:DUF1553 domain-containing protein [Planctomycetaceae bacterium]
KAIAGPDPDFGLAPDAPDADRRKRLAEWITSPNNPLFARVIVNRLWQYHFGRGIVATASDFGFNGSRPTHPELLDWLARSLQENGFRLKPIHRLIVTSATYRQSATLRADGMKTDSDNRFLWRRSPQRLTAEEIRDAALVFSDRIDRQTGGEGYRDVRHFQYKGSNFYESIEEASESLLRRTIYRFSPRGGRNPFLDTFDCPDPSVTTPQRPETTTPLQSLALMNNPLMFQMADSFAKHVERQHASDVGQQIQLACETAYARPAGAEETAAAQRFVQQFGLASFCRVLLNSNEFLYVR